MLKLFSKSYDLNDIKRFESNFNKLVVGYNIKNTSTFLYNEYKFKGKYYPQNLSFELTENKPALHGFNLDYW